MSLLLRPRSPRAGGCTFAEDPARDFRSARPVWSAALDPAVVAASAQPASAGCDFSVVAEETFVAVGDNGVEYVAVRAGRRLLRLDIMNGTVQSGPAMIEFRLGLDTLPAQLDALNALLRLCYVVDPAHRAPVSDCRLLRLVEALRVSDALNAGASARTIAEALRGKDHGWPGDGEHLKSWVRRRIALARRLRAAGAVGVLTRTV